MWPDILACVMSQADPSMPELTGGGRCCRFSSRLFSPLLGAWLEPPLAPRVG